MLHCLLGMSRILQRLSTARWVLLCEPISTAFYRPNLRWLSIYSRGMHIFRNSPRCQCALHRLHMYPGSSTFGQRWIYRTNDVSRCFLCFRFFSGYCFNLCFAANVSDHCEMLVVIVSLISLKYCHRCLLATCGCSEDCLQTLDLW